MSRDAKMLLVVSIFFTLAMGLSSIFINVFFWEETNSFIVIVIYNLTHYIFSTLTFILAGYLAKKKNAIWSLRIGLTIFALFFVLLLITGSRGVSYIYILGILYGIASGFYWLAYNTLSFDFTDITNRDTFNGYNGSLSSIAGAIAPIISAFIISSFNDALGYNIVFVITLLIFVLLVIISLFIKCKSHGNAMDFSKVFRRNSDDWNIIRKAIALWGVRDVVIAFIINILIIKSTGSVLSLGKLSFIGALISAVAFTLVQRIIKPPKRRISIFIGIVFSFIAVLGLFIKINYTTLLIYTIMNAFFIPFYLIQLSSSTFNVINSLHEEEFRIEYLISKELALNVGRIASSLILLLLLIILKDPKTLNYFLLLIGAAPLASGFFLSKLKKVLKGDK